MSGIFDTFSVGFFFRFHISASVWPIPDLLHTEYCEWVGCLLPMTPGREELGVGILFSNEPIRIRNRFDLCSGYLFWSTGTVGIVFPGRFMMNVIYTSLSWGEGVFRILTFLSRVVFWTYVLGLIHWWTILFSKFYLGSLRVILWVLHFYTSFWGTVWLLFFLVLNLLFSVSSLWLWLYLPSLQF